jgi:signal transduction histidine kinase
VRFQFRPRLSDLDGVALDSRRLAPWRIASALAVIAMVIPALGTTRALLWGAAILACEAWTWLATRPHARGRPLSSAHRCGYLAVALSGNTIWVALSLLFWLSAEDGSTFIALLIWCALLLNAVSFAFRSATALVIFAAPTVAAMVLTPVLLPRWSGPLQLLAIFGLLLCCAFALISAWRNVRAAAAIAGSAAALDIERRRAEQANDAKSAFLAFMSHEIRTPLNGVLGMIQAMERDELTDVQRERLGVVSSSGETLLMLLNDLLDLSRIEAGRLDLENGVVDVAEVAQAARDAFAVLATDKGLELTLQVDTDATGFWAGDPTRIRQILVNLVANAVKFTSAGAVAIVVAGRARGLTLTVSDTGPGIAPDRLLALFDRFVQADATTNRHFGGSGLGLSICRQLAELMGGSISAESRLGEGSRFVVDLPLDRLNASQRGLREAGTQTPAASEPLEERGLRLLVAEDNPVNRMVLDTLLGQVGLTAQMVHNGREAVEACAAADWDLVLMDVQMPVMDGPAASRAIRAAEKASGRPRIPIVALTANAMAHHRAEYLAAGMDAMVAKPIQLVELLTVMQQVTEAPGCADSRAAA